MTPGTRFINIRVRGKLEDYFSYKPLDWTVGHNADMTTIGSSDPAELTLANMIVDVFGIDKNSFGTTSSVGYVQYNGNTSKKSGVEVYILSAKKLTQENALKLVGQHLDELTLPEEGTSSAADKIYNYAGSVAMLKAESEGKTESAWVIAVTITQTPSAK